MEERLERLERKANLIMVCGSILLIGGLAYLTYEMKQWRVPASPQAVVPNVDAQLARLTAADEKAELILAKWKELEAAELKAADNAEPADQPGELTRIKTGSSALDGSDWIPVLGSKPGEIMVKIDTGLDPRTKYYVSLVADSEARYVTSGGILYPSDRGFWFYAHTGLNNHALALETARKGNWHVVWLAVEPVK